MRLPPPSSLLDDVVADDSVVSDRSFDIDDEDSSLSSLAIFRAKASRALTLKLCVRLDCMSWRSRSRSSSGRFLFSGMWRIRRNSCLAVSTISSVNVSRVMSEMSESRRWAATVCAASASASVRPDSRRAASTSVVDRPDSRRAAAAVAPTKSIVVGMDGLRTGRMEGPRSLAVLRSLSLRSIFPSGLGWPSSGIELLRLRLKSLGIIICLRFLCFMRTSANEIES
mmetsp:Transcript_23414/g.53066  ORF Transcript_23414/g.53066 Transcript_23414/m.53066 type:complete len:226 (+) Transcript_23414:1128-1805(+)